MLVVNNVTKKYGKFIANDNINFQVGDGEIAVLLGPNGAGKSTIIKCICGLLRFQGDISIEGFENKSIEAKKRIGYIPEVPVLYDMLTVEEHLEFIARGYKLTDWKEYAEELLRIFELDDKRKKFGKELSKGMQQKVSICCALLPKPKVIIFDEPLVGLDPHGIKALKRLVMELKSQGIAMIISTHMIDSVKEFWDVAHIMMNGKIAATKIKEDAEKSNEGLEELFFHITEGKGDQ
ncbi:ABC transporter ATP-binding protein [uncultured Clostridium sp.]|uniref:ABC transporter ATP-binding protein n=1 Tax=uncultured Clostridium sp. TaxID=59620 RepID=UPI0032166D85